MTAYAEVSLWGRRIGAVSLEEGTTYTTFEYDPKFVAADTRIEVSPLVMPRAARLYQFPELAPRTFHGLPGLLADSLPDKYGHALIDAWLASMGRTPGSMNVIERLCYVGKRATGALEYSPSSGPNPNASTSLQVAELVQLASKVLKNRNTLHTVFGDDDQARDALTDVLRVGTSAGGARAKALIAWNPRSEEIRSGQLELKPGFEHWLLKFDGVSNNRDKELDDPLGYGAIEYAYYLMARAAGIEMSESRLLEENGRRHFMTRRFDRTGDGRKLHMQSLCALAHFDYNQPGAYSYEQALQVTRQLQLPKADIEQQFRRMVFNIVARNHDDHVKNIAFLMDRQGTWKLSPAFDLTYAFNPSGDWTSRHQMTLNGKQDDFDHADFKAAAEAGLIQWSKAGRIIEEVMDTVSDWKTFAGKANLDSATTRKIAATHRLKFQL